MTIVRVNFDTYEDGEEYAVRLNDESNKNLKILFTLLSSYWQSTIDGPNYARELKSISIELARLRLALEEIRTDTFYGQVRTDFIYQVLTQILFPDNRPAPDFADIDFRNFLLKIIEIYFKGSIPQSMHDAVQLLVDDNKVIISENFIEARKSGSGFDISDQFGFGVDVIINSPKNVDIFLADRNIRLLLNIIRPAHTLFMLRFILNDEYNGNKITGIPTDTTGFNAKIIDLLSTAFSDYGYEDFRKFVKGIEGIDYLGTKRSVSVIGEDHSNQF
ncbi:MAG TPA: hypothetical protein ENI76_09460 [Ignavibacteria bacterium]|nr:hypothetical protein [Ignavibacteria bacterium]